MACLTFIDIEILEWLKRAEPAEIRERLEASWEETLEYTDSYAAIEAFCAEEPFYDEVLLANPARDQDVLDFLRSTSAETLFELLADAPRSAEGTSAYLEITTLADAA